jgi:hypothetical protein
MAVRTLKHGTVELYDASGSPITITLSPTVGDFSVDGIMENQCEEIPIQSRGEFLELVEGNQVYPTGSINLMQNTAFTDAVTKTMFDAGRKTGAFSAGTTSDPGGVVWTTPIKYTSTRSAVSTTMTLPNCRVKLGFSEAGDGNKIPVGFTCYGRPTYT